MKNILLLVILLFFFSCGKEKVVQLPEISHSDISEINDVSAAYLFYDETQPDSLELNRKNLISSTNWLINVDKRLTLKQAIPQITFLQDKKENSSHKKENTKNYFTCNDTSKKNLGFMEFTNVVYDIGDEDEDEDEEIAAENNYSIAVINLNDIIIFPLDVSDYRTNITNFANVFNKTVSQDEGNRTISLSFNNKLSFQDYITFKSILSNLNLKKVTISNQEFIFN